MMYNYSLNNQNQEKRLIDNATKPPLDVTSNCFKNIDGIDYPTNVNLQFNAGVYLSAIKPVLETVDVGWSADIGDWVLTCAKVSDRKDNLDEH